MRNFLITFVTMTAAVSAFSPPFVTRSLVLTPSSTSTQLFYSNNKIDTSSEIKAAMEATKKFGVKSPEARVAWETVEEINSINNRLAQDSTNALIKTSMGGRVNLATAAKASSAKSLAGISSRRSEALADAEAITKEKGIASTDARLAWELVEELAATEAHHANFGTG